MSRLGLGGGGGGCSNLNVSRLGSGGGGGLYKNFQTVQTTPLQTNPALN